MLPGDAALDLLPAKLTIAGGRSASFLPLEGTIRLKIMGAVCLGVGLIANQLQAQGPTADSTSSWARALQGTWSCSGAFASGKPLAADLTFRLALGGRWLGYHHKDRAPGRYEATALWGPAQRDTTQVPTILYDNFGGHRRFLPTGTGQEVVLLRDTTEAGAARERFTFRPRPDGSLWFAWEVNRQGAWALGDSLNCRKSS